jgi:hypothetical protein
MLLFAFVVWAQEPGAAIMWTDAATLTIQGKGWPDTKLPFDRLPAKAESLVRKPVWNLSRNTAGVAVRFVTDATTLKVRWTLLQENLAMAHMPATGVSGLDLYVNVAGNRHWLASGRPQKFPDNEATLFSAIVPGRREYVLYLPLYNGATKIELGVPPGFVIEAAPAYTTRPAVWYGTSITQGGCASRPGMVASNILSRRLNREFINLGFSGNGIMEAEMARLLAELDPAVYILANLENLKPEEVYSRATEFVTLLRQAHPQTPIVLLESIRYGNAFLAPESQSHILLERQELERAFNTLIANGLKHIHYVYGDALFGIDGEAMVDGVHATDVGFIRQADVLEPLLKQILENAP